MTFKLPALCVPPFRYYFFSKSKAFDIPTNVTFIYGAFIKNFHIFKQVPPIEHITHIENKKITPKPGRLVIQEICHVILLSVHVYDLGNFSQYQGWVIQLENIVCSLSFTSAEVINDTTSALEAQKAGLNFLPKYCWITA